MPRTFIALKLIPSDKMLEGIHTARETLKDSRIKWVETENLHITLNFLGDTDPEQLKGCSGIVQATAGKYKAPGVVFRGMGLFRSMRHPRVLWIGMETGKTIYDIQSELGRSLEPLGFPPDGRKFSPHLTIGRIKYLKQSGEMENLLGQYSGMVFQEVKFSEITYYESILRPEGPVYRKILASPFRDD